MALIASKTSCRSLKRVSTAFDFYRILRTTVCPFFISRLSTRNWLLTCAQGMYDKRRPILFHQFFLSVCITADILYVTRYRANVFIV